MATTNGESSSDNVSRLVQSLSNNAGDLRAGDARARDAMITDAFRLIAALETPHETFLRISWQYSSHPAILRLASDMKLFENLGSDEGSSKSSKQLADALSPPADPRLVLKVLKILASFYVVREVDTDLFAPTPFSTSMSQQVWKEALALIVPYVTQTKIKIPAYFQDTKYQLPTNALDAPVQYANEVRGKMHFFELMRRDGQMHNLESFMRVMLDGRPHWSDEKVGYYPIRERLVTGAESEDGAAFLVDVGGGQGQDFPRLLANVPEEEIPGRLVLQDMPDVIASIPEGSLPACVEKQGYDFFTEQPVKGARVYFMHSIIHNHPDQVAKQILIRVAAAMKRDYSKLLLWDHVMPDKGAAANPCCLDVEMMTFYAASQRSEGEWKALLEDPEVGLKITDVVRYSPHDQTIIEVELA